MSVKNNVTEVLKLLPDLNISDEHKNDVLLILSDVMLDYVEKKILSSKEEEEKLDRLMQKEKIKEAKKKFNNTKKHYTFNNDDNKKYKFNEFDDFKESTKWEWESEKEKEKERERDKERERKDEGDREIKRRKQEQREQREQREREQREREQRGQREHLLSQLQQTIRQDKADINKINEQNKLLLRQHEQDQNKNKSSDEQINQLVSIGKNIVDNVRKLSSNQLNKEKKNQRDDKVKSVISEVLQMKEQQEQRRAERTNNVKKPITLNARTQPQKKSSPDSDQRIEGTVDQKKLNEALFMHDTRQKLGRKAINFNVNEIGSINDLQIEVFKNIMVETDNTNQLLQQLPEINRQKLPKLNTTNAKELLKLIDENLKANDQNLVAQIKDKLIFLTDLYVIRNEIGDHLLSTRYPYMQLNEKEFVKFILNDLPKDAYDLKDTDINKLNINDLHIMIKSQINEYDKELNKHKQDRIKTQHVIETEEKRNKLNVLSLKIYKYNRPHKPTHPTQPTYISENIIIEDPIQQLENQIQGGDHSNKTISRYVNVCISDENKINNIRNNIERNNFEEKTLQQLNDGYPRIKIDDFHFYLTIGYIAPSLYYHFELYSHNTTSQNNTPTKFYVYSSNSNTGIWRLCYYFVEYEKGNDDVTSSSVHIILQMFITNIYKKIHKDIKKWYRHGYKNNNNVHKVTEYRCNNQDIRNSIMRKSTQSNVIFDYLNRLCTSANCLQDSNIIVRVTEILKNHYKITPLQKTDNNFDNFIQVFNRVMRNKFKLINNDSDILYNIKTNLSFINVDMNIKKCTIQTINNSDETYDIFYGDYMVKHVPINSYKKKNGISEDTEPMEFANSYVYKFEQHFGRLPYPITPCELTNDKKYKIILNVVKKDTHVNKYGLYEEYTSAGIYIYKIFEYHQKINGTYIENMNCKSPLIDNNYLFIGNLMNKFWPLTELSQ